MKKILLLSFLVLGISNSFAQLTCATAIPITEDGTVTCPAITGTYVGTCAANGNPANPNAIWYSYTATANGELTLDSDITQATGNDDTRVSVFIGTCTALQCYAGLDDNTDTNYLTTLTFPVASGVTYYIAWDDRWNALGLDFTVTFDVPACIGANATAVQTPSNITVDSAQLNWAVGIGNPASYDVKYGDEGFDPALTGTVVNTVPNTLTLSDLTPVSSEKDYYLRNNCGVDQSSYIGPFRVYLAKTLPFANNFDDAADYTNGFSGSGWAISSSTTLSQSSPIFYFTSVSTTVATNTLLYSRAIALQSNEEVTMTFYTRLNNGAGTAQTLKVWVNGTPTAVGATQIGTDITVSGNTYVLQTRTFTATAPGIYYFIFNNATPAVATATNMFIDTVALTSVLGTNQFASSNLSVFPNPSRNLVTISNDMNAVIESVEMTDLNGRVVKSQKINATEGQVSISDLSTGVYMMRIITDQGTATKKIVRE